MISLRLGERTYSICGYLTSYYYSRKDAKHAKKEILILFKH